MWLALLFLFPQRAVVFELSGELVAVHLGREQLAARECVLLMRFEEFFLSDQVRVHPVIQLLHDGFVDEDGRKFPGLFFDCSQVLQELVDLVEHVLPLRGGLL